MGAFPPPLPAGDTECYISDHTDIAMGLNAASKNKDDAKKFLDWLTTPEFAELYSNALPGFFSLNSTPVKVDDALAATMVGWRKDCKSTIRNSYQILSRGTPNLENELWNVSAQVINGALTPEAAGKQLQDGLDKWYKPAK
jgi:raffinose/stachyose/melibiose transport system substrate-binding protein